MINLLQLLIVSALLIGCTPSPKFKVGEEVRALESTTEKYTATIVRIEKGGPPYRYQVKVTFKQFLAYYSAVTLANEDKLIKIED